MARFTGMAAGVLAFAGLAGPGRADEVYVGAFAHDVGTFISSRAMERGNDINVGYRTAPFNALAPIGRPMAYITYFGNTARRTSYGAIGFEWRRYFWHDRLYGQVGFGGALHDQPLEHPDPFVPGLTPAEVQERLYIWRNFKALGTRLLFNPNLGFGVRLSKRWALEGVWSHVSNAGLGGSNPGMDDFGGRVVFRFGPNSR
jgi:lipid A 3-O-deacylase